MASLHGSETGFPAPFREWAESREGRLNGGKNPPPFCLLLTHRGVAAPHFRAQLLGGGINHGGGIGIRFEHGENG